MFGLPYAWLENQGRCLAPLTDRKRVRPAPVVRCGIWFGLAAIGSGCGKERQKTTNRSANCLALADHVIRSPYRPVAIAARCSVGRREAREALSDLKHDLPAGVAGLTQLLRLSRIGKRQGRPPYGFHV